MWVLCASQLLLHCAGCVPSSDQPLFGRRSMGQSLLNSTTFAIPVPHPSGSPTASVMLLSNPAGSSPTPSAFQLSQPSTFEATTRLKAAPSALRAAIRRVASELAPKYVWFVSLCLGSPPYFRPIYVLWLLFAFFNQTWAMHQTCHWRQVCCARVRDVCSHLNQSSHLTFLISLGVTGLMVCGTTDRQALRL